MAFLAPVALEGIEGAAAGGAAAGGGEAAGGGLMGRLGGMLRLPGIPSLGGHLGGKHGGGKPSSGPSLEDMIGAQHTALSPAQFG